MIYCVKREDFMRTWDFRHVLKPLVSLACKLRLGLCPTATHRRRPRSSRAGGLADMPAVPDQPPANPDDTQDNTSGVYVRDSAIAQEKIAQAKRMQSLKEWNKSADLYSGNPRKISRSRGSQRHGCRP